MNLDPKSKGLLPGGEVLFGKARDFFEADCWLELADYMESEDDVVGSVKALENAIAVLWRYPDYGGYQIEKVPAECKEIWERIASLEGLDGFDIALSQCMLRSFEKRAAR